MSSVGDGCVIVGDNCAISWRWLCLFLEIIVSSVGDEQRTEMIVSSSGDGCGCLVKKSSDKSLK